MLYRKELHDYTPDADPMVFKLVVVGRRVPTFGDLFINARGKVQRCQRRENFNEKPHERLIVQEVGFEGS